MSGGMGGTGLLTQLSGWGMELPKLLMLSFGVSIKLWGQQFFLHPNLK